MQQTLHRHPPLLLWAVLLTILLSSCATKPPVTLKGPAMGPLWVHPTNPRYFTDGSGKAVYLTGAHTWTNLQNHGKTNPPAAFDYPAYLDFLQQHNMNFMRMWAFEQPRWDPEADDTYFWPLPYERAGPDKALDGGLKFDVTRFNPAYFDRLRSRVAEAGYRGIYVSIMLFQGWSIEKKGIHNAKGNPWMSHPFNESNNINGVSGDLNGDGEGTEVHTLLNPSITDLQKAYVRHAIDTVNDLDNVMYEIANESHSDSAAWQIHLIDFIHAYEAKKHKQHPVLFTAAWGYWQ